MEPYTAFHGNRLDTISQDLAFVEERLVRAMKRPDVDHSLGTTLDRLRELRGMVAVIQAKHAEVASAWISAAAAARGQACCLHYLRMLGAASKASRSWANEHGAPEASEEAVAPKLWAGQFASDNLESLLSANEGGIRGIQSGSTPTAEGNSPAATSDLQPGHVIHALSKGLGGDYRLHARGLLNAAVLARVWRLEDQAEEELTKRLLLLLLRLTGK
ncbi:hypothetical protein Efla_003074 [Eimeria flavescens]